MTVISELVASDLAFASSMRAEQDAYRFLARIDSGKWWYRGASAAGFVMSFYRDFILRVSTYPAGDRDALLHAARKTFNVRMAVLRNDLDAAMRAATR